MRLPGSPIRPIRMASPAGAVPRIVSVSKIKARIVVTLKPGVLDPQGKAIESALTSFGIRDVDSVRQGKVFDVEVDAADPGQAEATLKSACEKLLANTVIENYAIEIA